MVKSSRSCTLSGGAWMRSNQQIGEERLVRSRRDSGPVSQTEEVSRKEE